MPPHFLKAPYLKYEPKPSALTEYGNHLMLKNPNSKILKAFTLLELIVVIVVLGILAMLAVPTFNTVKEKSADSVANQNASAIQRDFNAQAALAQSDPSIVPSATGAWVVNGTSYSYTATAGNTGQNVVASKANGGSGGGAGYSYTQTFTQADYLNGSCVVSGSAEMTGTNSIGFYCASDAMKTAIGNLSTGSKVRITYSDSSVEEYDVASVGFSPFTKITMTTTMPEFYIGDQFTSIEM